MRFKILSAITGIEVIARRRGIRRLAQLRKRYGAANWRKLKGTATIQYEDGTICLVELHWYEVHGIGRRNFKVKRILRYL